MKVVTGFSADGYELYGRGFVSSFCRWAPPNLGIAVYMPHKIKLREGEVVLHSELKDCLEFVRKHQNKRESCGLGPVPGWRDKDHRNGYSYRFDSVKFCWQLFYPEHAAQRMKNGDILVWFDGDVVFHSNIDTDWIKSCLAGADLTFLGRTTHTELGFWAIRLTDQTRAFLKTITDLYRTEDIFKLDQWHSAFVFDHVRGLYPYIKQNNLTEGDKGNVWERVAPLRLFSYHLKGRLKLRKGEPKWISP